VSPARRAQQTAQALSKKFETSPAVSTAARPSRCLRPPVGLIARGAVVVVGHQPTLGAAAALALTGSATQWSVKKGAVWWLERRERDHVTVLRAVISPDLLENFWLKRISRFMMSGALMGGDLCSNPANLSHKVSKLVYHREEPKLRAIAQRPIRPLRERALSRIDSDRRSRGAGKGETVNLLNEWMDPRHITRTPFPRLPMRSASARRCGVSGRAAA